MAKTVFKDERYYELIAYGPGIPFRIHNISQKSNMDPYGKITDILEHWHYELEIVYTFAGNARHYIDGSVHVARPGSILIVNSESIHKVISDDGAFHQGEKVATVLNINMDYLRELIPDIDQMYFEVEPADGVIEAERLMRMLSDYGDQETFAPYEALRVRGMAEELLYYLCRKSLKQKEEIVRINDQRNVERFRGIMQYVREHYREELTQKEVAESFYFTREYFSRFFKKNTGLTFTEYLTKYRVSMARNELLQTNRSILEIGVDNGFADARGFINAFKAVYGTTPLQYRKRYGKEQH